MCRHSFRSGKPEWWEANYTMDLEWEEWYWEPFWGASNRGTLWSDGKKRRNLPRLLKAMSEFSKLPILKLVTTHSQINWNLTVWCVLTGNVYLLPEMTPVAELWATAFHKCLTLDRANRNLTPFLKQHPTRKNFLKLPGIYPISKSTHSPW